MGGHICVSAENTKTYYINPVNQIHNPLTHGSDNEIGKFTLFQNCIPHYTDKHMSDKPRITIAMDLSIIELKNFVRLW